VEKKVLPIWFIFIRIDISGTEDDCNFFPQDESLVHAFSTHIPQLIFFERVLGSQEQHTGKFNSSF